MDFVEEDFPRGGPERQTTESKIVVPRAEVDNLFQLKDEPKTKKRKGAGKDEDAKVKKNKIDNVKGSLTLNAEEKNIHILHVKDLKEGMLMLGCVKEVADFEVTVGLPCGLQGFLNIKNICDSYTKLLTEQLESDDTEDICSLSELFLPGMLLRCVIAKLDVAKSGSISVQLSINPKLVNAALTSSSLKAGMVLSGCVESIEDHGFIIDIGVGGNKAFAPRKLVNTPEELKVGQYVISKVKEVKNDGRVAQLSISPLTPAQAGANSQQEWSLSNLLPGLLVKATVKKATKHGLLLDFLSSFSGQVDFLHMEQDQVSSYSVGAEVQARLLYIEPSTRLIGLTLRNYLVGLEPSIEHTSEAGDCIGEVVKGCHMTAMHHLSGAVLGLPDKRVAFVHRNHLTEPNQHESANKLLAMAEHTCRILSFSPVDQIHFATLRKSMIDKPFFRYQDVQVGQLVEGTVTSLVSHGMVVQVSSHIRGLVPRTHLSDILLKNPEKKYIPGMTVKCRVLSVDHENKKLYMTRKKSLIESDLPRFLSYGDARKGLVSHGYIVSIKDFGCIVRFYNEVKGLVPTRELSSEPVINPADVFYVGQVLKAKVLHCDPSKAKMLLSFKAALEGGNDEPTPPTQFECDIGTKLEAKVLKKTLNGLEVAILPEGVRAFLPTTHLSDHVSNCLLLWENLQEGDVVSNLTCVFNNQKRINVTKKPTVVSSLEAGLAAKDFSEIKIGMQIVGWVKNIMTYGVFVEFPNGLFGLAPCSALTDKFLKETANTFQIGQTVIAKVTNLDEEKRRFLITLRISDVMVSQNDAHTRLFNGLKEKSAAVEMSSKRDTSGLVQTLAALTLGQRLKLTVDSLRDDGGATFKCDDLVGANIVAIKNHLGGNSSVGQQVAAVVLHVDVFSSCVHVSTLKKLIAKKTALAVNTPHTAMVQLIVGDFAVVSLGDTANFTMIQTRSHLNEISATATEKMKAGMILAAEVVETSCAELQGLPLVSWKYTAPRQHTESQSDDKGHRFGDILQGKVRTVKPTRVVVSLEDGSLANVHVSEIMDAESLTVGSFPTSSVKVGSMVTARVIGGREVVSHRFLPFSHPRFSYKVPELTIVPSKLDPKVDLCQKNAKDNLSSYVVGDEITCFVSKFSPKSKMLEVTIDLSLTGTVELLATITDPKDHSHPDKLYKLGQVVRAKVVENGLKPQLSLTGFHQLKKDIVTLGIVTSIQPHTGLHVKLPFGGTGAVSVTDLADAYKPKLLDTFKKEQLVRCYLLSQENGKWHLSLRPSRVNPETAKPAKDPEVMSFEDLKKGQVIRGYIKSVGEKGVFVTLSSTITGRAQFQMSTKYFVKDHKVLSQHLPPNTLLTTKIISIDKKEKIVDLSLLSEDTGKPDVLPESLGLNLRLVGEAKVKYDSKNKKKRVISESEEVPKKKKKKNKKTEDSDSGVEVYFREEEDKKPAKPAAEEATTSSAAQSRLQVAAGFCWDVSLNSLKPASAAKDGDSSDEEEQDDSSKPQKKTRHELEKERKAAEKALVQRETELMDPNLRPQDAAAFERLLLASPNSSLLWLQYMAHHLQATQIEQARAVAERALKTISFREEQEKLNVWVALMNLENMYGTEESLKKVFERALQFCEPMPVHQQLADIYANSDKIKEAEAMYKSMVKRFRQDKASWLSYGTFLLQRGESEAAGGVLQRALKSLPTKQSVDVIAKFAQLEFRFGDAERGRAMFDKVMTSYPKRIDLWSVFIDLMIKYGSQKDVRALFDRVIHLSVSVKKIKFFFKRYLEYEKKHGTPQSVQAVKEKAVAFVEAKGTEAAS